MRRIPLLLLTALAALACGDPPAAPTRRPPADLSFGTDAPPPPPPQPVLAANPPTASAPAPAPEAPKALPVLKAQKASEATMMIYVTPSEELVATLVLLAADPKSPRWTKAAKERIADQAASGSGFVVATEAPGSWIATNAHVVEAGWKHLARTPGRAQPLQLEPVYVDRDNDIAILLTAERIPGLAISEKAPEQGDAVSTVGFPGMDDTVGYKESRGAVTNICYGAPCYILHSAVIGSGNSGGPLLEGATLSVVGINTGAHAQMKHTFAATRANYIPPAIQRARDARAALGAKKAPPGLELACGDVVDAANKIRQGIDSDLFWDHLPKAHPQMLANAIKAFQASKDANKLMKNVQADAYLVATAMAMVTVIKTAGTALDAGACKSAPELSFADAKEPTAALRFSGPENAKLTAVFKWSRGAWRLLDFSR